MKNRYIYPAILRTEEEAITVTFPDLEGCVTFGRDEEEALRHAKEALEGYLYLLEKENLEIPSPSLLGTIFHEANEALVLVDAWMPLVRDQEANRSVKKTLTLPKWLNDLAEMNKINFSHTLQSALKTQLGLEE